MSTEPALMSLTAVAKAIADKQVSSHEAARSCLHRIAHGTAIWPESRPK